ncbi:uncharacterized protein [Euwallacea fornicatus]|uniref:uncharacterized protein isoform X1 n=1 Tax=Euwallacea fornicatus TaxID=995702 RepID=UPI00338F0118
MELSSLVQCDKRTRVCRQGASADSNNMKTAAIVLQVAVLVLQYRITSASYGFAKAPKTVRFYLDDGEALITPKQSQVRFVDSVISDDEDEFFSEKTPNKRPKYISKGLQDQFYSPVFEHGRSSVGKGLANADDLRLRSHPIGPYFGSYLSGYAPSYGRSLGGSRVFLQPQEKSLLLNQARVVANPWFQAVVVDNMVKPVKEEHPDDLKYDFRTKVHSFR